MAVKIVTDSTSDIDGDLAQELGVTVVAQNVHFGDETYRDNVTLTPDQFYLMLAGSAEMPRTSQASPGSFKETYDSLGTEADGIVSIHISSKISGTCNSAQQGAAAATANCPIEVIDSLQATMGLGLVVAAAAEAARRGDSFDEVVAAARSAVARAQTVCLFETLEYLEKGGRIGKAQALMGSMLRIKPMVIVREGAIHPLGKARSFARGLEQLKRAVRDFAPLESLAVMYSTTPYDAARVAADLHDLLPEGRKPYLARFGPAIGVHTGPGALGIALLEANK